MAYINFPIKLLKKIEPLLEGYFSYERSMFHLEFEEIHNIYIQNGKYSKEQEETYLAVPSFKQSYIETSLNTEKMYETMMQVGKGVSRNLVGIIFRFSAKSPYLSAWKKNT